MQVKISLKTILLFTALFILGTMILGFYSCSSGGATVTPQMTDEDGTSTLQPGTTVLSDGTIITTDGGTTVVTTTTPSDGDGTSTDTTTTITYELVINEDGTADLRTVREGQSGGDTGMPVYLLTFSDFVETSADVWEGTMTLLNNTAEVLHNPRIAYMLPVAMPVDSEHRTLVFENIASPDYWWTQPYYGNLFVVGHPMVFIADEDEDFEILPGEEATHPLTIDTNGMGELCLGVNLMFESCPEDLTSMAAESVPHGIDISLTENSELGSTVTVILDVAQWDPSKEGYLIFTTDAGDVVLNGHPLPMWYVSQTGDTVEYEGVAIAKPSEDGETTVTVYFTSGQNPTDQLRQTYIQQEVFS